MEPGEVIAERFELVQRAGAGGMGEVFRARDRSSGEHVAVKILLDGRAPEEARFDREALALSELHHPGIVRYVTHGVTPSEKPYIVMEWLEGEELACLLRRRNLSAVEGITVIRAAADALSAAHACGIVHRDLKPSNLFLVGGDIARVKLLDFGIAKLGARTRVTLTGTTVGTPAYMAPEQARSGQKLDPRADIFALGCVLFECLTGRPVFRGDHVMAILAKILFAEAPRVREICPDVPAALDDLIARMLAKNPNDRPRDAIVLAAELKAVGELCLTGDDEIAQAISVLATELTGGERHLLSVVLMSGERRQEASNATTIDPVQLCVRRDDLRRAAEARGGRFELLSDGSAVVTLSGTCVATDQAAQAARCALALRALGEGRPIALATGHGKVTGGLPAGDVIDRAAMMLPFSSVTPETSETSETLEGSWKILPDMSHIHASPHNAGVGDPKSLDPQLGEDDGPPTASALLRPIAIDEVTAGLLDARFLVRRFGSGFRLHGERLIADDTWSRTLLGKPTALIGRDRELATFETLFAECVDEPLGQALLVTGPPGVGKSRLLHAMVQEIRRRGAPVAIWKGRGDAIRAGSAFGLLGQALRGACGISDGEALPARREKLVARVAKHVHPEKRRRVAEFLGELIGTPMPDDSSAPLRAARQDAQLMGEQMRWAWEELALAETAEHPVLLIIEDLHWGDLPTVRFVDAALRTLRSRPFLVVASARPEVHELFPRLWSERRIHELRLKELTRKASEKLVRHVLGDAVAPETLDRIVTQADGNALYLEELIRAVAEGRGDVLPASVVAMVEARLEGLEGEARRLLRAASIFGEVFWEGGVTALLGGPDRAAETRAWTAALVEREVLVRRQKCRFPGEVELVFRHTLLREGAYAMLTEEDRLVGHRLAGEWLSRAGESDPMTLAEHFERGNNPVRAGTFYQKAAEQAYRGGDSAAALARVTKGLTLSVGDRTRIALLGLFCEISGWRNDWSAGAAHAEEVMLLADPGTVPWCRAVIAKLGDAMRRSDIELFIATLDRVRAVDPAPDAIGIIANTLVLSVYLLDSRGRIDFAEVILRRMEEFIGPIAGRDPIARGWMNISRAYHELWVNEDPWAAYKRAEAARSSFHEANHRRGVVVSQVFVGMGAWCLGALAEAERELRAIEVTDEDLGLFASLRPFSLIGVLADRGALDLAAEEARRMIEVASAKGAPIDEGRGRWALAEVLRRKGDLDEAGREAVAAQDLLKLATLDSLGVATTLASIDLSHGRVAGALAAVEETLSRRRTLRAFGLKGAFARLVYIEALTAAGEVEAASASLTAARERLLAQAAKITDAAKRRSFLKSVPENALTLELSGGELMS